jgi:hypothetical protein
MKPTFAESARTLAGMVCRMLGWRPSDFWESTPAEISVIFTAQDTEDGAPLSRVEFETLMKRDGNG